MLYHKLLDIIPDDSTELRDILATYANEQDGYLSLYAIMRTKCKYLRILQPLWGPKWSTQQSGYQYLAAFKSFVDEEKRFYRHYSIYDQAAEVLQQAAAHEPHKLIATSYITKLMHMDYDTKTLPPEFHPNNLINVLESTQTNTQQTTDTVPTIHKFNRKPFQYRIQKQCSACKVWGHDIDEQVCRICAQVKFCNEYIMNHPEKANKNATAFALAHNRTKVSRVRQALGEQYDYEDDEDTIMSFARAVTIGDEDTSEISDTTEQHE